MKIQWVFFVMTVYTYRQCLQYMTAKFLKHVLIKNILFLNPLKNAHRENLHLSFLINKGNFVYFDYLNEEFGSQGYQPKIKI